MSLSPSPRPSRALIRATKALLLALACLALVLFFSFHLDRYLSMATLKESGWVRTSYQSAPWTTIGLYSLAAYLYVVCSLPAATLIMLLAGALFGPWLGTLVCVLSVSLGAVTSLLMSRFLFRDFVQAKFARQVAIVDREYHRSGATYLVAMRLIPILPYFVTNLVFGLTTIRPAKFWILSLISSTPAIFIYSNAGSEISKINSLSEILTPRLLIAFLALAALPFIGKFVTQKLLRVRPPPKP